MSAPTVSVIVVSRGRAADLPLCLTGLSQLDYPAFEIILVADPQGIGAAKALSFFEDLKVVPFDEANISAARNLGIAQAAGEITAFIDDDAVPEPTWLTHLVAGFSEPDVACAGGFVIGRNGISFQWKARSVDVFGDAEPLEVDEDRVSVLTPRPGRAIKTEGTNMALRRAVLAELGGFDPVYRFYLDETDVNMRLAFGGYRTAIAPLAQVHHGYKASATRRGDRVPRDLFEIGASTAVFLRKYAGAGMRDAALQRARQNQRHRALRHMVSGALEPRDIARLMGRFDEGVRDGFARTLTPLTPLAKSGTGFAQMPQRFSGATQVFSARIWQYREKLRAAEHGVQSGHRATLFVFSPTARPHHVRFGGAGVWVQSGGLFGRSTRRGVHFRITSFRKRLVSEVKRISRMRGISASAMHR